MEQRLPDPVKDEGLQAGDGRFQGREEAGIEIPLPRSPPCRCFPHMAQERLQRVVVSTNSLPG